MALKTHRSNVARDHHKQRDRESVLMLQPHCFQAAQLATFGWKQLKLKHSAAQQQVLRWQHMLLANR